MCQFNVSKLYHFYITESGKMVNVYLIIDGRKKGAFTILYLFILRVYWANGETVLNVVLLYTFTDLFECFCI